MGKNKGGGFNMFESYLASGLSSQSSSSTDNQHIPLPDSMRTSTLLEQIGKDRQWSDDQIAQDIVTLENNRLYYVRDLRELSKGSWKAIELLPLVKDLLRNALKEPKKKNEKKKKTEKKKHKKEKRMKHLGEPVVSEKFGQPLFTDIVSEDPETIRNTIQNVNVQQDTLSKSRALGSPKKSVSFSENDPVAPVTTTKVLNSSSSDSSSSSSSSSSSGDSDCEDKSCNLMTTATTTNVRKPKVFSGRSIQPVSANRIRVQTTDGSVYEADRFCPHKKVDLSTWGQVVGNTLICSKHNWKFSLDGTSIATKGRSINPCKVNDW